MGVFQKELMPRTARRPQPPLPPDWSTLPPSPPPPSSNNVVPWPCMKKMVVLVWGEMSPQAAHTFLYGTSRLARTTQEHLKFCRVSSHSSVSRSPEYVSQSKSCCCFEYGRRSEGIRIHGFAISYLCARFICQRMKCDTIKIPGGKHQILLRLPF